MLYKMDNVLYNDMRCDVDRKKFPQNGNEKS